MSKRKDEEKDENSKVTRTSYSGVEEEWDSFDRKMVRFMRKKFDDFGEKLWMGEIPVVETLTHGSNEYAQYCIEVYHAISINDHEPGRWNLSHRHGPKPYTCIGFGDSHGP